ncbi:MAG: DUF4258 domain-containing protein [Deltaproteobacteria bacterium]|nr:DUF4258 domain-containing protein [Deltaproteobacteria bacterium]
MPRKGIREIRERVRTKNYEVTGHAEEEREDDDLAIADLRSAIQSGRVAQILTDDPRGNRYVVRGKAQDGRAIEVVCRFLASGRLRILTIYALEEK